LSTFKYLKVFYRKIDPPDIKVAGKVFEGGWEVLVDLRCNHL